MERPRTDDRVQAAGMLLFRPGPPEQFLLMRHADRWDLPKGHAEPGESALQTALRETQEETGIAPHAIRVDPRFRFRIVYPVRYREQPERVFQKEVVIFLGEVDNATAIECSEHQGSQWFEWKPPHPLQAATIDPLLAAVAQYRRLGRRA